MPTESEGQEIRPQKQLRRWPGVIFSLLVPGFGLIRAGQVLRGVLWYLACILANLLTIVALTVRAIPTGVIIVGLVVVTGVSLAMLIDSFRPGKMSGYCWLALAFALATSLFFSAGVRLIASAFTVPTNGMAPTIGKISQSGGDRIVVDKLAYKFQEPRRGEIVAFRTGGIERLRQSPDLIWLQRIVGLPGETIEIRDGEIFANGRALGPDDGIPHKEYHSPAGVRSRPIDNTFEVPEGCYFMLGDNARNSLDSRFWGFLPKQNIVGRAARIYYPFDRVGVLR